jgi:exportin-T
MFDVLDQLVGPLSAHITALLSQTISGTDDERAHVDTKKAYLALLNSIMATKLNGIFTSESEFLVIRPLFHAYICCLGNSRDFEALIESVQRLAEDISDPPGQKGAFTFLNRCVSTWGQPPAPKEGQSGSSSLPGFDRFIYERLVPTAFRVLSLPGFNPKDGQMIVASVIHNHVLLLPLMKRSRCFMK